VLLELVNMLSAPPNRSRAHTLVDSLRAAGKMEIVPASSEWMRRGLLLHSQRADKFWSLTDCISFEIMLDSQIQDALTQDHHFEQAGFRALLRHPLPG
jgi:predicted nucleic acid-binding protein